MTWERARATVLSPFAHLKELIKLVLKGGNFFLKNLIFISYLYWKKKEILIFNLEYLEGKFRRVIRDETFKCVPFFSFRFFYLFGFKSSWAVRGDGGQCHHLTDRYNLISLHTHTHTWNLQRRENIHQATWTRHTESTSFVSFFFLFLNFLLY